MNLNDRAALKQSGLVLMEQLKHAFDVIATWVTQLSWWKFFLFAILVITAGAITQNTLFSSSNDIVIQKKIISEKQARHGLKTAPKGDTEVEITSSGIHIHKNRPSVTAPTPPVPPVPPVQPVQPVKPVQPAQPAPPLPPAQPTSPEPLLSPTLPPLPVPKNPQSPRGEVVTGAPLPQSATSTLPSLPGTEVTPLGNAGKSDGTAITFDNKDVHITLPPNVGQDVQDAIDEAVDDAAAKKVETYRERGSDWFMNFVLLLVLGLFGTKALMGGKKRAEAEAAVAHTIAEREAMQRQVTEARMQMMQAQVEPHFLFNTLASVEYLIETDPPRASKMQRSLIQYLRAVIPQMRESAPVTNLGREIDMVSAYLDLLKMRMEERLSVELLIPSGLRSAAFPPMMLQSLVENAIKHGLECKPDGGLLRITAEINDNRLRVAVADTGMGFGTVASDGTGLGLQNIRERLKLLHGGDAQLIIAPNLPSGVTATIDVPYRLAN